MNKKIKGIDSLVGIFLLIALLLMVLWAVENPQIALMLYENPSFIWPFLLDRVGLVKLIFGSFGIISLVWLVMINADNNGNVLRGATVISHRRLKAILKKEPKLKHQPQLQLGGLPIPARYENRGFFVVGSPGSGKTQAISQMVAILKQRTDFRGLVFDRGGEMLEKFYDPQTDIIFNPFDARSCHWSHVHEPARPKTIAAGLIPLTSSGNNFFPQAGRIILAELFRQTKSNAEVYDLLQSDLKTLSSFLSGTLAARYLEEERVATSVLSTVTNYCEFYSSITHPRNKALSFYDWSASNSPRWIFLSLRENDTEILKPLYSLIFELTLRGLLSHLQRTRKTAIVIDELGALNQLPSLHRLLSESRKFQGCPILGTQTEAQINKIYSREDTSIILQGTRTKLIMNCADPQTALTMAENIGKQEFMCTTENRSRSFTNHGGGRNISHHEQLREGLAVMSAQLQKLPDLQGYLKFADLPVAKVKVKYQKFPTRAQPFVPLHPATSSTMNSQPETIQQQWQKLIAKSQSRFKF